MADLRSGSGNPILRHQHVAPRAHGVAHADDARIGAHIERFLGAGGMVWHEIISDRIHIDVHAVPPSQAYPFHVLVTSGMSALPMSVPTAMPGRDEWLHAELCILLGPEWPLTQEAFADERHYWPIRLLKSLARLPHDFSTWLGWGHSIPNGDPPKPYAQGTQLCGSLIVPPFALGTEFFVVPGEPALHVFQVLPVTAAEMKMKLDVGLDRLLEEMEQVVPDAYGPIQAQRRSAC